MKYIELRQWTAKVPSGFIATLPEPDSDSATHHIRVVGFAAKGVAICESARVDENFLVTRGCSDNHLDQWTVKHIQVDVDYAVSRLRAKIKSYREDRAREKKVKAAADARLRAKKG